MNREGSSSRSSSHRWRVRLAHLRVQRTPMEMASDGFNLPFERTATVAPSGTSPSPRASSISLPVPLLQLTGTFD
jgi:hypothetical protein